MPIHFGFRHRDDSDQRKGFEYPERNQSADLVIQEAWCVPKGAGFSPRCICQYTRPRSDLPSDVLPVDFAVDGASAHNAIEAGQGKTSIRAEIDRTRDFSKLTWIDKSRYDAGKRSIRRYDATAKHYPQPAAGFQDQRFSDEKVIPA